MKIDQKESAFHKADTLDGQWLSLVKTERNCNVRNCLKYLDMKMLHQDGNT